MACRGGLSRESPPLIGIPDRRMHVLIAVAWLVSRKTLVEVTAELIVGHDVRQAERVVTHRSNKESEESDKASRVA